MLLELKCVSVCGGITLFVNMNTQVIQTAIPQDIAIFLRVCKYF